MKITKMGTVSRLALAAAASMFISGAANAGGSVGGDCCADLEERVAELEATTARKGNRKVSLEVSGHVNKAVVFYDGPVDSDTIIIDNPNSQSRFRLKGSAKISADLYAGYVLEFGVAATTGGNAVSLRHNDLYIGSKTFGKISIGHGSQASDGITEIDLSGTGVANGTTNLSGIGGGYAFTNLDGNRRERIRYDTPSIAGFKLSASWDENEEYDVAVRYGGSLGDFTVAAGVAYINQEADSISLGGLVVIPIPDSEETRVVGSASVFHTPTGLNLSVAAGNQEIEVTPAVTFERDYWYVKAGIKRKLFAAGATAFSVDYQYEEVSATGLGSADGDKYGFQLVQNIDAAAMELYLSAWSADFEGVEEDAVMIGSRIKF